MFIMMNAARYAVGIQGIAVSERALQKADEYASERVQGRALEGSPGAVPIVSHPDVQRMLMTMRALTEGARALAYVAAGELDRSRRHADPAVRENSRRRYEYLVPVVKGFSTETAVEVASLGVQVHGGMGYIEETGAAQYYRDARILPIYEGTTAIQANDFIGRKTLRDGAAVARDAAKDMLATVAELSAVRQGDRRDALGLVARRLEAAVGAYARATDFVLANAATDLRAVFFGSVPYLMLTGVVHAGWHMARAALACARRLDAGEDDVFLSRKFATAVFYAGHILPRAEALATSIIEDQVVSGLSNQLHSV
jgi:alkylation response protein AidB-like acyl-CoA dehydrogenase